ncbi:MAG: hypothetical protein Q7N50_11405 [Armatimonadota bacterium]|nr:hypothetical protein [Armatimonadota bacterium]
MRTRIILLVLMVAVAAGIIYQVSLNRQRLPDDRQIAELLQWGIGGVEKNDPRQAVSIVSKNYKDDAGMTYTFLRIRTYDALRSDVQPDVTILKPSIRINGDNATLDAQFSVIDRKNDEAIFTRDLTLHLRREKLRRYLIFSTHEWRIVSIEGVGEIIENM